MEKLTGKDMALGIQHLFAMFGATILVPLLTGLNPSTALVSAGIGTLIFHLCTKFKVPVFQGSSFAYLGAIAAIVGSYGIEYAQGGIIFAGLIYLVIAIAAYFAGPQRIKKVFPPVVTGPVIVVIGLSLVSTGVSDATNTALTGSTLISLAIALFTMIVVVVCTIFAKGFFKLVPILIGLGIGYLSCILLDFANVITMDYSAISMAHWINIPYYTEGFFTLPKFDLVAILAIAPIALVTCMEHIGDITTNGAVVGKDFFKDPGLHRTLLGDGLASMFAGFIGGPANTTYSENTGVLATTKNYNPNLLRIAAVCAVILGIFGKFGAILQTIPTPVRGGVEFILFGMISAIGIRTLAEAKLDFTHSRNLIIVALILSVGTGFSVTGGLAVNIGNVEVTISGLFLAVIIGILFNLILPQQLEKIDDNSNTAEETEA
ncbi:MAG TPA: uracil-xanthine permease family protein [Clostridiales bacterium]|nr:uracil-xanthine permease family protein [Clostridiales bacterium]